ncbi:MAG TPA: MFS transporter [Acidobacteriaceae bacterium]|nr:MFS transporter [Acidobacteriaceae bacterium]
MSAEATDTKPAAATQEGHRWWLFTACVLVSLTNELSTAVTNLSLGPMRRDLGASSAVMQMAVTLGRLMLGAFMLAGGVAGDIYGRRRVLVLGALGMVGASLLAAFAQTGGMLLVARALDGLASAAIGPMALALIVSAFSQAEQARVIGLFLGLSGLGTALGPLAAGLAVQAQGWRAGFLMPAAVAVLGGFGVFLFASGNGAKTAGRRLDSIGALTCAAGLLGLVFGIIQINHLGLLHPRVLQSVAVGIGALLAFVWWERRAKDPLLDVTLFRNRIVSVAVTAGLLAALVVGGALLPLLYFLQTVQKVSPISAIVRLMPLMIAAAAFAPVAGELTTKIGPRKVIAGGLALMAAGSSLLISLGPETPYGQMLLALGLLGVGDIAVITPVADVILSAVPKERTGSAAAVNGAAMQIGGALGTAVLSSLLLAIARTTYYQRLEPSGLSRQEIAAATEALRQSVQKGAESGGLAIPESVRTQLADAYRHAFSVGAAGVFTCSALVCLLCAVLVWFGLKKISRQSPPSVAPSK